MAETHQLKTWPEYFERVASGDKPFEYRQADRPFAVGDLLHLREYVKYPVLMPKDQAPDDVELDVNEEGMACGHWTGRELFKQVTYIYPIPPAKKFVVMGLGKMTVGDDTAPNPWQPITDPVDLAVLGKSVEELGEAVSALGRAIIQGMDGADPGTGKLNRDAVRNELADVAAATSKIVERFSLDVEAMRPRVERKRRHLGSWFAMLGWTG